MIQIDTKKRKRMFWMDYWKGKEDKKKGKRRREKDLVTRHERMIQGIFFVDVENEDLLPLSMDQ